MYNKNPWAPNIYAAIMLTALTCHSAKGDIGTAFNEKISAVTSWFTSNKETDTKEYQLSLDGQLHIDNPSGNIKIHTWDKPSAVIETIRKSSKSETDVSDDSIEVDENKISINTGTSKKKKKVRVDYNVMLPSHASATIKTQSGNITVHDSHGTLDLTTDSGTIEAKKISGDISATTKSGPIKISYSEFPENTTIVINSGGQTTLALPKETNSQIHAQTTHGLLTSTHPITIDPIRTELNATAWSRFKRKVNGIIGKTSDSAIHITSYGSIKIFKR